MKTKRVPSSVCSLPLWSRIVFAIFADQVVADGVRVVDDDAREEVAAAAGHHHFRMGSLREYL